MILSNKQLIRKLRTWDKDHTERTKSRVNMTGEIFTPTALVQEVLSNFSPEDFSDSKQTFLDPCCGNGQFLSEVLILKLENNIDFATALSTIYGIDLMIDNVEVCRNRLLCDIEELRHIVERNIVWGDALNFDYSIWDDT